MYPFIPVLRNVQKSKGPKNQEKDKLISDADKNRFLEMVNGMINNGRGFICLQFDDVLLKDSFHGKVDSSLRLLLPDGWHYSAVFVQRFVDKYHLHLHVRLKDIDVLKDMALMNMDEQPSPCTRPLSTKEFYLKYPTESGLYLPTYQEVTWLIKHIAGKSLSQQTNNEEVVSTRYRFVLNEQVLSDDDKKRPILESVNVQLKHSPTFQDSTVQKIADNIESSLHIAQYISTFANIPGGGSIFFGIEEKAKKEHPDLKEPICRGIGLSKEECEDLGKQLGGKIRSSHIQSSLMWATIQAQAVNDPNPGQNDPTLELIAQTPEKIPITFLFHQVWETSEETSKDLFVLEVRVKFFNGIVFNNGTGPRAYKYEEQQLKEIEFENWAKEHECTVKKGRHVYTCTLKKHNWASEEIDILFRDEKPSRMEEDAVDDQQNEQPRMEEGAVDEVDDEDMDE